MSDIFTREISDILEEVKALENDESIKKANALPSNCYFLSEGKILCYPRDFGDSRYPYNVGGRVMWVYSSGMVTIEESTFNIILPSYFGDEPRFLLNAGVKKGEFYDTTSILSKNKAEENVKRFMVFSPLASYFITVKEDVTYAVKLFINADREICFSVNILNDGENKSMLFSTYLDLFMTIDSAETFETKWYKKVETKKDYSLTQVFEYFGGSNRVNHFGLLRNNFEGGNIEQIKTASKSNFCGGYAKGVREADCLKTAKFEYDKSLCTFTEKSIHGDVATFDLKKGESVRFNYVLTVSDDKKLVEEKINEKITTSYIENSYALVGEAKKDSGVGDKIKIFFNGIGDALKPNTINNFLANVINQVDFCAKAKNFAGAFLGVRDIFQQVEAAIMWNPEYCREKIIQCLDFISIDGRPPRQFSFPIFKGAKPAMDLRKFIDQGVWVISTVYTYLTFTDDYSILDEICGYYDLTKNTVELSDKKDSVLDHLINICDYLVRNIDENTGCLKALYGDWNDALDGLGRTQKQGVEFGNGCSVMASLQLYKCLVELVDIFNKLGIKEDKKQEYSALAENLKEALLFHAIEEDIDGNRKVIHGWGDDASYFVGSYCDNDGKSRDSTTSNAFWVLCGGYKWDESIKKDILAAYDRLDSKYGIMTFNPGFEPDNMKVGRISCLPIGTAENAATYIHGTLFAIWSLFEMGEGKKAVEQLLKILPVTHEKISTTPFIMSNSYLYNPELCMDGESMNDWFTGSGCVLAKVLVKGVFGVKPNLNGIEISPSSYFPCDTASMDITVKGVRLNISYENKGDGRKVLIDGVEKDFISLNELNKKQIKIEIID